MPDTLMKQNQALFENLSGHIARTENLLSSKPATRPTESSQEIEINIATLCVSKGGIRSQPLTAKELQIISLLNSAENRMLTRASLMTGVWSSTPVSAKTLDVHIFNLRRKLAAIGLGIIFMPPNFFRLMSIEIASNSAESQVG